ncbi:hypothetical protein VC83_08959 [Pseudogymnoascus destructans]|uniref:Polysaccharide export protein n=2 Tax=Pseudogymnoascus destructans TaxID=655981 RepID=L8GAZ7_PSED2|nr:uncharacterized protein VC83_08959 [Pseudogymnoascus destructans]ELR10247.1 hypothetical protein GMDG_04635 [Pseudogymnoascus destructans 20631-21]OAF54739.1 hypothetical protein VC83_08959 [Pseudogymnoascus destructans]
MHLGSFRRRARLRRTWLRLAIIIAVVALYVDYVRLVVVNYPLSRVSPSTASMDGSGLKKERIFIASMHWNNERIIRSHWSSAVLDLVKHFGAENVYISVAESGSWDNTKGALRDLDAELEKLGVERNIELKDITHKDEIERTPGPNEAGWIQTSRGKKELRRIPYLAEIRNNVMAKLQDLAGGKGGREPRVFDKVIWLNDVVFTTEDVTTLIATRDGDYAAACSIDFSKPPQFYDTFALRDVSGGEAATQTWPFFLDSASRKAMITNTPVPVKSCWNGIVVFQVEPFYGNKALSFRGIPDSLALRHLEGSECCLIHADNRLTPLHGVWLNPNVRVSYNPESDKIVRAETGLWPTKKEKFVGIWMNRFARLVGIIPRYIQEYKVGKRMKLWGHETRDEAHGEIPVAWSHCLINEMQVLVQNGWKHL